MNQHQELDRAADLLKVIAHPIRMKIILLLDHYGPLSLSSLGGHLQIDPSLTSHNLTKMKDKGLLTSQRQGKEVYYTLADPTPVQVVRLLLGLTSQDP